MNLQFTPTANGTKMPGIMDFSNDPPTLFCYCSESKSEIILKAMNAMKRKQRESKMFQVPTIEEVQEYCDQRKNGIDAEKFWHSYNSKDWFVGRVKMKSWRSAIVTWEKNPQYNTDPANDKKVIGRSTIETVTKNASNWQ